MPLSAIPEFPDIIDVDIGHPWCRLKVPRVAAAIVTYRKKKAVLKLLQCLHRLGIPTFVTENASDDGTAEEIERRFPSVSLLKSAHNLGGTGGFNCATLAALSSGCRYVVLLDDDVLPEDDCIVRLADFLDAHEEYVFAAPAIYIAGKPGVLQETGGGVDFRRTQPVEAWNRFAVDPELPEFMDVDYASACCLMVRSEAIRRIGVMDWHYFIFSDDVDWSLRLRRAFGKGACVTVAKAHHEFPWAKPFSPMRLYFFQRNLLYMIARMQAAREGVRTLRKNLSGAYRRMIYSRAIGDFEISDTLSCAISDALHGRWGAWGHPVRFGVRREAAGDDFFHTRSTRRVLIDITIEDMMDDILAQLRRHCPEAEIDLLCDDHRVEEWRGKGFDEVFGRPPGRLAGLKRVFQLMRNRYDLSVTDASMMPRRLTSLVGRHAVLFHDGRFFRASGNPFRGLLFYGLAIFFGWLMGGLTCYRLLKAPSSGRPPAEASDLLENIHVTPEVGQPWGRPWMLPFTIPTPDDYGGDRRLILPKMKHGLRRMLNGCQRRLPQRAAAVLLRIRDLLRRRGVWLGTYRPPVPPPSLGPGEPSGGYEEWCRARDRVAGARYPAPKPGGKPRFSVLVPVCDPEPFWLEECIASVRSQTYGGWELILSDDASIRQEIKKILTAAVGEDFRIRTIFSGERGGISRATNRAAAAAKGEFLVFLDHDDLLDQFALAAFHGAIDRLPNTDLIYADEDRIDADRRRIHPGFKPDFSPDRLLATNYIHHPVAVRKSVFHDVGGLRSQYDGSQDHDLLLRISERSDRIVHIPDILYHMRLHDRSLASGPSAKPEAHARDRALIEDALNRRGIHGKVEPAAVDFPGYNRMRFERSKQAAVSVVVVVEGPLTMERLERKWHGCEIIVTQEDLPVPEAVNRAAACAAGEVLIVAGSRIEPDLGWRDAMIPHLLRDEIGLVTGKIVYPDNRLYACGLILGTAGSGGRWHHGLDAGDPGYGGWMAIDHEVSAVPWRWLGIRKKRFDSVGGFDTGYERQGFDVDLALRLSTRFGCRHLAVPAATAVLDAECLPRKMEEWPINDRAKLWMDWSETLGKGDPCFNPNFSLCDEGVRIIGQSENDWRSRGVFVAYDKATSILLGNRFNSSTKPKQER